MSAEPRPSSASSSTSSSGTSSASVGVGSESVGMLAESAPTGTATGTAIATATGTATGTVSGTNIAGTEETEERTEGTDQGTDQGTEENEVEPRAVSAPGAMRDGPRASVSKGPQPTAGAGAAAADNEVAAVAAVAAMVDEARESERTLGLAPISLSVLVLPAGYTTAFVVPAGETVDRILEMMREYLELGAMSVLSLAHGGSVVGGAKTLMDVGVNPGESIQVALTVLPPAMSPTLDRDEGGEASGSEAVHCPIDRSSAARKPFLGGYRHRITGIEYHHASTQVDGPTQEEIIKEAKVKFTRETQTVKMVSHATQSKREAATQMTKNSVYIDDRTDKVLTPGVYVTADEVVATRIKCATKIQACVRGFFARRLARKLRTELEARRQLIAETEAERMREAEVQRQVEIERRMHPRTAQDFELLYNELEAWRLAEIQKINGTELTQAQRQKAMEELLAKEVKLLQTIDRLKNTANRENRTARIDATLGLMARPKLWALSDGSVASVHTPFTIRAKELSDLYNGLMLTHLSIDERLDVLLHVKWSVKEFDCDLTRDIVELIDREADLLNRGRSAKSLVGLRKRLLNLFLQFIETPEFNPEAARFQRVPEGLVNRPNVSTPSKSSRSRTSRASSSSTGSTSRRDRGPRPVSRSRYTQPIG